MSVLLITLLLFFFLPLINIWTPTSCFSSYEPSVFMETLWGYSDVGDGSVRSRYRVGSIYLQLHFGVQQKYLKGWFESGRSHLNFSWIGAASK